MKRKIKAVIFDYDGVIADTMMDNFRAWRQAFARYGVIIKKNDYFSLEGMSPKMIVKNISTKYKIDESSSIISDKEEHYRLNNSFRIYEGMEELLIMLKAKCIKIALVTGALRKRVESTTPRTPLSLFDVIVTANDVAYSKPHPEPYQKALQLLDIKPEEAAVIENAPLGVESAKAAGIYCIAICSTLGQEFLVEADEIIPDIDHLRERLKSL